MCCYPDLLTNGYQNTGAASEEMCLWDLDLWPHMGSATAKWKAEEYGLSNTLLIHQLLKTGGKQVFPTCVRLCASSKN